MSLVGVALAMAWMSGTSITASQAFAGDLTKAWGTVAVLPIAAVVPARAPACGRSPLPPGERAKRCRASALSPVVKLYGERQVFTLGSGRRAAPAEDSAASADGAGSYPVAADTQTRERALLSYEINGDAVPEPLSGLKGDAVRGKAIVLDRRKGNCLICHAFPVEGEPFQGEIGPPMAGVGSRLTKGQIRLRLIDQSQLNPETIMPPLYRVAGLTNVAPEYDGRPALNAQEIEDVVAYLGGLTE